MAVPRLRVVLDTNVILRGLLNSRSASGMILEAVDHRLLVLLTSKPVLTEYRAVLTDPVICERFPQLSDEGVEAVLRRLRYFGEYVRVVRARFSFPRDPRDESR